MCVKNEDGTGFVEDEAFEDAFPSGDSEVEGDADNC